LNYYLYHRHFFICIIDRSFWLQLS